MRNPAVVLFTGLIVTAVIGIGISRHDDWGAGSPGGWTAWAQGSPNQPPVADAGRDRTVQAGDTVVLNGGGTYDPDGDLVTLSWQLVTAPPGSLAALTGPTLVKPSLTVDVAGDYVVELVADDGTTASAASTVRISTVNSAPLADAGPDRKIGPLAGETVELDATGSTDSDGDFLSYQWVLVSRPAGSAAVLDDPTSARPSFFADIAGTYEAEVTVGDGLTTSAPDQVTASTDNLPPIAEAEPPFAINPFIANAVLDSEGSGDPEGAPLSLRWTIVANEGFAGISDATPPFSGGSPAPAIFDQRSFLATAGAGAFVVQLTATDPAGASSTDTMVVDTVNAAPVANAGLDQAVTIGSPVMLDGAGSSDPDRDEISFRWALVHRPAGSVATLSDPAAVRPRFTADVAGTYVAQLTVFDGAEPSEIDTVVLSTDNVAPMANAGPDQLSAAAPTTITLDADSSLDSDLDPLTYRWSVVHAPPGSTAQPDDPSLSVTTMALDEPGLYLLQLVVNDGFVDSTPDHVVVGTLDVPGGQIAGIPLGPIDSNLRPVAEAGPVATVSPGALVQLDGSGSSDPNAQPGSKFIHTWSLLHKPVGSTASIPSAPSIDPTATFTADIPGIYLAQLTILDTIPPGFSFAGLPGRPAIAVVIANNRPVADAGPDQTVGTGVPVTLDGSGSSDADLDPLTFAWTLVSAPAGSTAALTGTATPTPELVPDLIGQYVVELVVNDGLQSSDPDQVVIDASVPPPLADAGPDQQVRAGARVQLDGSGSSDPQGEPLSFAWSLVTVPQDSTATLVDPSLSDPSFVADLEGVYVAQLIVSNSGAASAPDTVTITAVANQPPVLDPIGNQSVDLGTSLAFTLSATDGNGDIPTFAASPAPLPDGMTLNAATGAFSFTPGESQVGDIALTFIASDGVLTDSESVIITVVGAAPGGITALSGRLLDTNDFVDGVETPIVGATVSLLNTGISAVSDAAGNFVLSGVPSGQQVFDIDASTANPAPDGSPYAGFREALTLLAGVTNAVERPFFLPRIATASLTTVDPQVETVVTNAELGVTLTVAPFSAFGPDGDDFTGQLSISEVPLALAPAALPEFLEPGLLITIQPVGVTFDPPAALTMPNTDNLTPGSIAQTWSLDPERGEFGVVGIGRVSTDGSVTETIAGGIVAADWHARLAPATDGKGFLAENFETCCDKLVGSTMAVGTGGLTVTHELVGYTSFGETRSPELTYDSLTADPQPVVISDTVIVPIAARATAYSTRLRVGGIDRGEELFTRGTGIPDGLATIRQSVQFDASPFASGVYPFQLLKTSNYQVSRLTSSQLGEVIVNNQQTSPFGAGWNIDGFDRLVARGTQALLLRGDGSMFRYPGITLNEQPEFRDFDYGSIGEAPIEDFVSPAADFNGDGIRDFLVSFAEEGDIPDTGESFVRLFLGDGDGGFPVNRVLKTSDTVSCGEGCEATTSEVIPGDFNGDGVTDVLVSDVGVSELKFFPGLTAGFFDAPTTIPVSATIGSAVIKAADFDGDGIDDIVLASRFSAGITLLLSDGSGAFPIERDISNVTGESVINLFPADINNDGAVDLVVHELVTQGLRSSFAVALNDGLGNFTPVTGPFSGVAQDSLTKPVDVDGDGNLDLVAIGVSTQAALQYYWGDGEGNFARDLPDRPNLAIIQDSSLPGDSGDFILQDATDIDGDGDGDFVVSYRFNFGLATVLLYFNDGVGNVPDRLDVPTQFGDIDELQFDDIAGDGLKNLFVRGDGMSSTILVSSLADAIGTAAGTFSTPQGDFSRLTRSVGGTFSRRMKDGTTFNFDTDGLQTSVVDRNGNQTTYGYDVAGRLTTITDPAGLVTTLTYTGGLISSIEDPAGRFTFFEHDAAGNLIKITDPDGSIRQFAYDERHRMISQTSKRGFVTHYEYNFAGRAIGGRRADGSLVRLAPRELVGVVNPMQGIGGKTTPAPFEVPEDAISVFTDPNGNELRFTLDRFGGATEVTDGLGRLVGIERNDDGRPTLVTSPRGFFRSAEYDLLGNIRERRLAIGQPEERVITFEHEPLFSRLIRVSDPRDGTILLDYDQSGNLIESIDADGNRSEFAYQDAACPGFLTRVAAAVGTAQEVARTVGYDPVTCRETQSTDNLGNVRISSYDPAGNLVTITDQALRVMRFEYDQMNRLTKLVEPTNTDPAPLCGTPGVTCLDYDIAGNLQFVTDGNGNVTEFVFDERDRLIQTIDPLNLSEFNTYDAAGNLRSVTDRRGRRTEFEYDAADQIVRQIFDAGAPGQTVRTYGYDQDGNLTSVSDVDSALTIERDAIGRVRLVSTSGSPAQPAVDLVSTYDSNDNRLTLTDPTGVTVYQYSARNFMESVLPPGLASAIVIAYDEAGRRSGITRPNGIASVFGYDAASRPDLIEHGAGASILASFDYDYTPASRVDRLTQTRSDLVVEAVLDYGYEAFDQLVTATHPVPFTPAESFAHDPAGNLLRWPGQAVDATIGAGNRLLQDEVYCYDYDANGNRESRTLRDQAGACTGAVTAYTHDAENRLVRVDFPDGTFAAYRYDALGRRIEKDVNGVVTRYVYDGEDILLEYDGSNVLRARYTHGPDIDDPLLMQRDVDGDGLFALTEQFHYHTDVLGSVVALTDSAGEPVRSYLYTAFGTVADEFGLLENPYTFTGREFDAESGLYFYRARHYDGVAGRFLQEDPIGYLGGDPNLYRYARNSPGNFTDPLGLELLLVAGVGTSAVGPTGGFEGSAGKAVSFNLFCTQIADFNAFGAGAGINASADAFVGVFKGDRVTDIAGHTGNVNVNIGPISISVFLTPGTLDFEGVTAGVGTPFPAPGGLTLSDTNVDENSIENTGPCCHAL